MKTSIIVGSVIIVVVIVCGFLYYDNAYSPASNPTSNQTGLMMPICKFAQAGDQVTAYKNQASVTGGYKIENDKKTVWYDPALRSIVSIYHNSKLAESTTKMINNIQTSFSIQEKIDCLLSK